MAVPKRIVLGSGKLYLTQFSGSVPDTDTICVDDNLLGYISGGATLAYTPTFYTAQDDLGYVTKTIITEEEVTLTSGIMTFNGNTLEKLCDTARVSEDATTHLRTVLFGGISNADHAQYVICFHHPDPIDGDIWVIIVGNNQNGFSLAFAKDQETVIDAEFKALAQDDQGTLIKYIEQDTSIEAAAAAYTEEETSATFVLTSDTTVQSGKTYYSRTGSGTVNYPYVYLAVSSPAANPSAAGYYEIQS